MILPIPDKFEDLSPTQVEEFARFGFDVFCSVRDSILHSADFNSRCQKITEQQQELIKAVNASVTKLKD